VGKFQLSELELAVSHLDCGVKVLNAEGFIWISASIYSWPRRSGSDRVVPRFDAKRSGAQNR